MTGMIVQTSRLIADLHVTPPEPPPTVSAPVETAVAVVPRAELVPVRSWAAKASQNIMPSIAGSAWLLSLGIGLTQGASIPLVAAVAAAGVSSALLIRRSATDASRVPATHVAPADARTHFNYATDANLGPQLRLDQAQLYVNMSTTISGADAVRLFEGLPRGCDWGRKKEWFSPSTLQYNAIMARIGLTNWKPAPWTPSDLEIVIVGLSKLGPVTANERASIDRNARDIVSNFHDRHEKKDSYRSELLAAVSELVRRAPEATSEDRVNRGDAHR